MLPRGEQRAMLLLSLLLILSLAFRVTVQVLPAREPHGMEQFIMESRAIMAELARADSLEGLRKDSLATVRNKAFPFPHTGPYHRSAIQPHSIKLNTVDSAGLLPLPGIGPVFAGRIVRYRELLGGYVNSEQLSEVYGLKAETIQLIAPFLLIDTSHIRKLKLNTTGFRELLRHPYLEYDDVKAIVKFRDLMGRVTSIQELRNNMLVPDSTLEKAVPYLDLSN